MPTELRDARDRLDSAVRRALEQAIDHVRRFAETQRPASTRTTIAPGIEVERRWTALDRVGAYVPGGSAPYPSSLVMTVVPARVAGVGQVVVASPADGDGRTNPVLLGAAGLLEVDAFVVAGGAQAIGALAFGLPDAGLAPVDRIVGPGNAWVTAAKIEVCGEVGIDLPAGPSEGMVLATSPADPGRVAADLITQAEHGPDSPAILVTTDATLPPRSSPPSMDQLERATRRDILAAALHDPASSPLRRRSTPPSTSSTPTPPSTSRSTSAARADGRPSAQRGLVVRRPVGARIAGDYATGANHVLPTGGLARASGGLSVEAYGKFVQVQRIDRDGLASIRATIADPGRGRGPARPSRRRRDPFRGAEPDEPDAGHLHPAECARRPTAGRRPTRRSRPATGSTRRAIVRFDLNTSPAPPALVPAAAGGRPVRGAAVRIPTDRLPAAGRGGRGPLWRDGAEILVGAGADEILDIVAKAYIPAGGRAVVPVPDLRHVPGPHRAARRPGDRGRATGQGGGLARSTAEARAPPPLDAAVVWLCSPNNPTALAEPDGAIRDLLLGLAEDAAAAGRPAPIVVLDEAYAEFVGTTLIGLRDEYPNLIVVRTASKAYALAGLRVGFAVARRELVATLNPYRPPGSVSTVSVTLVTEALLDPGILDDNLARVAGERTRLRDALRPWLVGRAVGDQLHAGRLRLRRARGDRGRGAPSTRPRPAHVRCRPSAGRPPAPDRARPERERPAHRGRRHAQHGGHRMTTTLGSVEIGPREGRRVTVARTTAETDITVTLGLDGEGHRAIDTASGSTITCSARSPTTGCSTGHQRRWRPPGRRAPHGRGRRARPRSAFAEALGDRAGIARFGQGSVPMDEALAHAVVDVGGRPYAVIDLPFRGERAGGLPLQLIEHALESFSRTAAHVDDRMASASSIGTSPARTGAIPARSPSASANAEPRTSATSSTVWCSSTWRSPSALDGQIEQAVVGERAEQVIVEPDAGVDRPMSLAIEPERDGDVGLGRGPGDRHATALAWTDLDGAKGRGHPVASVLERGGDRDEPVVLVRVAHGQAQVVGQRMTATERARDEAVRKERLGHGRRALGGAEVDQQEVGHRRPDRPAHGQERVAQADPLAGDASEVVVEDPGSRSASVTRVTDTVETEPGGRNGLSVAISSRRATANPTRSPASA